MTAIVATLTFLLILAIGIIIYIPAYRQYFYCYEIRLRPRKQQQQSDGQQPKDSTLLAACALIGECVLRLTPTVADKRTRQLLAQANYRSPHHMATYIGIKCILMLTTALLFLPACTSNPLQLLLLIAGSIFAWLLPAFFLAGRVRQRQQALIREIPTFVDLMVVCAQAGLGLLMSIDKVSKEVSDSCPGVAGEFQQLLQDVKLFAKPLPNALAEMAERCGIEELTGLASALISCQNKGSDISYPLKQQSAAIRERMKRKREEEASRTPVKMVPVIMFFVMPLVLCPLLGPAIIVIWESLAIAFGHPPQH
jgi:tight adherence protein C